MKKECEKENDRRGYYYDEDDGGNDNKDSVGPQVGGARNIVGQDGDRERLVTEVLMRGRTSTYKLVGIVGMAGIGKTVLARSIYEDERVVENFEIRAWVTVSQEYRFGDILSSLLESIRCSSRRGVKVFGSLSTTLQQKRYLIVVDDVWDNKFWGRLEIYLPEDHNRSRVILTTRRAFVAQNSTGDWGWRWGCTYLRMKLLDKSDSWKLLSQEVFPDGICPPHLEKLGREIARKCHGLPLTIKAVGAQLKSVAGRLHGEEETKAYWSAVATEKDIYSLAATRAESYLKTLYKSYEYTNPEAKACFLYMGAFPEDSFISGSKLCNLFFAERLSEKGEKCLKYLENESLILVHKHGFRSNVKVCSLHPAYRRLCVSEAAKNGLLISVDDYTKDILGGGEEEIQQQRMLSIHNNVLFVLEDVREWMASVSDGVSSFLCIGPYHPYPTPNILKGFKLLKVLDALTIRFYCFPRAVLKLFRLRYLAVTLNRGDLPRSIWKLQDLEFLIVDRNLRVVSLDAPSYVPEEIWRLKLLRHLQIVGSEIQIPTYSDVICERDHNLLTLYDVGPRSCTKEVFQRTPKLKKLRIRIELQPRVDVDDEYYDDDEDDHDIDEEDDSDEDDDDDEEDDSDEDFIVDENDDEEDHDSDEDDDDDEDDEVGDEDVGDHYDVVAAADDDSVCRPFEHLAVLGELESFKCVVVNPGVGSPRIVVNAPISLSIKYPSSLIKMTLSGTRLTWEDMKLIGAQFPELEVLKLKCHAFVGPKWKVSRRDLPSLKLLHLEDLDLETFILNDGKSSFISLGTLIIRHCYKLEEIPYDFGSMVSKMEVVDCRPSAMDSATKMKKYWDGREDNIKDFTILSSLEGEEDSSVM